MADFTPGPWQQAPNFPHGMTAVVGSSGRDKPYKLVAKAECEANARLIAAAPDGHSVISRFRQKLATYVSVYPGDKELRGLLADCDAYLAKVDGGPYANS